MAHRMPFPCSLPTSTPLCIAFLNVMFTRTQEDFWSSVGGCYVFLNTNKGYQKAHGVHYTSAAHPKQEYEFSFPPDNDYIMYRTGLTDLLLRNRTSCWAPLPSVAVTHAEKDQL